MVENISPYLTYNIVKQLLSSFGKAVTRRSKYIFGNLCGADGTVFRSHDKNYVLVFVEVLRYAMFSFVMKYFYYGTLEYLRSMTLVNA